MFEAKLRAMRRNLVPMNSHQLLLFIATVLPLICVPGPDMLFITSQAISGKASSGFRATAGVCAGYVVHSALVALGLAAVIAASPILFAALRWAGVGYLLYLAIQLLRSAAKRGTAQVSASHTGNPFRRGFLTAVLNPKGMMIYFAILPQFMSAGEPAAMQAAILSAIFVFLCGLVYSALSVAIAASGRRSGALSEQRRRYVEGISGGIILVAAAKLAAN
jgi:threonine/homoserine/homoserine lactone efflux protein